MRACGRSGGRDFVRQFRGKLGIELEVEALWAPVPKRQAAVDAEAIVQFIQFIHLLLESKGRQAGNLGDVFAGWWKWAFLNVNETITQLRARKEDFLQLWERPPRHADVAKMQEFERPQLLQWRGHLSKTVVAELVSNEGKTR